MPILNPGDTDMVDTVYCYHLLKNIDANSFKYIERFGAACEIKALLPLSDISYCVSNGLKEEIKSAVKHLLIKHQPLEIIQNFLMPALDKTGRKYESGEIFLPQLLNSAEAAKAAFDIIKDQLPSSKRDSALKIILATVKGDVHDIGKNIVRVLLENYGYTVIDLGKDADIKTVAAEAVKNGVKLVGLSALMTTSVDNMEKTIAAVKKADKNITVMVGGAALTEAYAKKIGADFYGKDAMAAVAIANNVFKTI
jgi:5-methyltetrahydrofolate--homocysteine methyltransferase